MQVRTYVHGTLYSLLSTAAMLEQAYQRGLADMLQAVSASSEPVFQRHIAHILRKIEEAENGPPVEEGSEAGEDEDDDMDMMEYNDEYDEMEEVMCSGALQMLSGAVLVASCTMSRVITKSAQFTHATTPQGALLGRSSSPTRHAHHH